MSDEAVRRLLTDKVAGNAKETARHLVSYLRVSTDKQGIRGLGMEAQQTAVEQYRKSIGGVVIAEYREVESGRVRSRPQLKQAIRHARSARAILIVAKLDRLARNTTFISQLLDSDLEIVCCDCPNMDRHMLKLFGWIAEREVSLIRQRTKDALAAYKARGGKLGTHLPDCKLLDPKVQRAASRKAVEVMREKFDPLYRQVMPRIRELAQQGKTTAEIAQALNDEGHDAPKGGLWSKVTVWRLLRRRSLCLG
jgi:DNA invertase Pin-like site-specific DNA recombinase